MGLDLPRDHQLRYLGRRAADVEALKAGLLVGDYEVAILIGHRLKGSGETFGFPMITSFGSSIEQAGLAKDKKKLLSTVELLSKCVEDYLLKMKS